MWNDKIVEEVRKARDEFAAKFNYDIDAIYREIKKQEAASKRKFASFPRRPLPTPADRPTHEQTN